MTMFRAVLAALLILPMLAWADPAEVVGVLDGDTVTIRASAPGVDGERIDFGEVTATILPARC